MFLHHLRENSSASLSHVVSNTSGAVRSLHRDRNEEVTASSNVPRTEQVLIIFLYARYSSYTSLYLIIVCISYC
jgi:hypothetical protein